MDDGGFRCAGRWLCARCHLAPGRVAARRAAQHSRRDCFGEAQSARRDRRKPLTWRGVAVGLSRRSRRRLFVSSRLAIVARQAIPGVPSLLENFVLGGELGASVVFALIAAAAATAIAAFARRSSALMLLLVTPGLLGALIVSLLLLALFSGAGLALLLRHSAAARPRAHRPPPAARGVPRRAVAATHSRFAHRPTGRKPPAHLGVGNAPARRRCGDPVLLGLLRLHGLFDSRAHRLHAGLRPPAQPRALRPDDRAFRHDARGVLPRPFWFCC